MECKQGNVDFVAKSGEHRQFPLLRVTFPQSHELQNPLTIDPTAKIPPSPAVVGDGHCLVLLAP